MTAESRKPKAAAAAAADGEAASSTSADPLSGGADPLSLMGTAEMRMALIPLLLEEETVVQALRRLGKSRAKGGAGGRGGIDAGATTAAAAPRGRLTGYVF